VAPDNRATIFFGGEALALCVAGALFHGRRELDTFDLTYFRETIASEHESTRLRAFLQYSSASP